MSTSLFSYYGLGLQAMNAARLGLQVAGDNISNVDTPGYAKRRVELTTGQLTRVQGGFLDQGVDVLGIRRVEDRLVQASLEREKGTAAYSRERLAGLRRLESAFGTLEGESVLSAYSRFSQSFSELAAQPADSAVRRTAISSASALAESIRDTYDRLRGQKADENRAVAGLTAEVNDLAQQLADLNVEIASLEAGGSVAAPIRDRRQLVAERLVELTGGVIGRAEGDRLTVQLPGGPTLVTAEAALPLTTTAAGDGSLRLFASNGADITDRLRAGELGARISVRDESISQSLDDLDAIAADLITRTNQITTAAFDADGNAGGPLFDPDPAPTSGAAAQIAVSAAILADSDLLAVSQSGSVGDGLAATEIAGLLESTSIGLGTRSPLDFLSESLASLGNDIVKADVEASVSADLVTSLESQRNAVSGVSLDEEAVALIKNQRAYEAAARFMQVINEITEIAVNIG